MCFVDLEKTFSKVRRIDISKTFRREKNFKNDNTKGYFIKKIREDFVLPLLGVLCSLMYEAVEETKKKKKKNYKTKIFNKSAM